MIWIYVATFDGNGRLTSFRRESSRFELHTGYKGDQGLEDL